MGIYDTELSKVPIKELKDEYMHYFDMVKKTQCYGVKDTIMFYKLEDELNRRGYVIEEDCKIYKEE